MHTLLPGNGITFQTAVSNVSTNRANCCRLRASTTANTSQSPAGMDALQRAHHLEALGRPTIRHRIHYTHLILLDAVPVRRQQPRDKTQHGIPVETGPPRTGMQGIPCDRACQEDQPALLQMDKEQRLPAKYRTWGVSHLRHSCTCGTLVFLSFLRVGYQRNIAVSAVAVSNAMVLHSVVKGSCTEWSKQIELFHRYSTLPWPMRREMHRGRSKRVRAYYTPE